MGTEGPNSEHPNKNEKTLQFIKYFIEQYLDKHTTIDPSTNRLTLEIGFT